MLRNHIGFARPFTFTPAEVARMFRVAPLFDVEVQPVEGDRLTICVQDGRIRRSVTLPREIAHIRVLTELCEKTIRWVYYHDAEHCARSLLSLTDARLARLAELYREKGGEFPSASEELAEPAVPLVA